MNNRIYVGAYIEFLSPLAELMGRSAIGCANPNCTNYNEIVNTAYCPHCGNAVANITIPKDGVYSVLEEVFPDNADSFLVVDKRCVIADGVWLGGVLLVANDHLIKELPSMPTTPAEICEKYPMWDRLCSYLEKQKIKYTLNWGVVYFQEEV